MTKQQIKICKQIPLNRTPARSLLHAVRKGME